MPARKSKSSSFQEINKNGAEFVFRPVSLSNNPKFQAKFGVMNFVLTKNVYSLMKALYW